MQPAAERADGRRRLRAAAAAAAAPAAIVVVVVGGVRAPAAVRHRRVGLRRHRRVGGDLRLPRRIVLLLKVELHRDREVAARRLEEHGRLRVVEAGDRR